MGRSPHWLAGITNFTRWAYCESIGGISAAHLPTLLAQTFDFMQEIEHEF